MVRLGLDGDGAIWARAPDKDAPHKFSNKIDSLALPDLKLNTSRQYQRRRLIESGVEESPVFDHVGHYHVFMHCCILQEVRHMWGMYPSP